MEQLPSWESVSKTKAFSDINTFVTVPNVNDHVSFSTITMILQTYFMKNSMTNSRQLLTGTRAGTYADLDIQ